METDPYFPDPPFRESRDQVLFRMDYGNAVATYFKTAELGRDTIEKPPAITDVYVPLHLHEKDFPPGEYPGSDEEQLLPLLDAVITCDRLAISGPPGSGKSTLCRMLAYSVGRSRMTSYASVIGRRVVVPIILRSLKLNQIDSLDQFWDLWLSSFSGSIRYTIDPAILRFYLENGWCLVMFDGVDELGSDNRKRLRDKVVLPFCQSYPNNKVIVTGRPTAFSDCPYKFETAMQKRGPLLHVQPFSDEDITTFSKKWFELRKTSKTEAARFHEIFQKALNANQSLSELKYRPVFLTMLAVVHEHQGRLPDSRAEAYRSMVDTYIDQLDATRRILEEQGKDVVPPWPKEDKKRILERLAYRLFTRRDQTNVYTELTEATMKNEIKIILEDLSRLPNFSLSSEFNVNPHLLTDQVFTFFVARTGFIIETSHQRYQFSHLSFQEYLTALHIYRTMLSQRRDPIAYLKQELTARMKDFAWHEVGILFFLHDALEIEANQDELIDGLIPNPMTDGFFMFWVKLVTNNEVKISSQYRSDFFKYVASWSLDFEDIWLVSEAACGYKNTEPDPQKGISYILDSAHDNQKKLARYLVIISGIKDISEFINWKHISTYCRENYISRDLIRSLDHYNRTELSTELILWIPVLDHVFEFPYITLFKPEANTSRKAWSNYVRILLSVWLQHSGFHEPHAVAILLYSESKQRMGSDLALNLPLLKCRNRAIKPALNQIINRDLDHGQPVQVDKEIEKADNKIFARSANLGLSMCLAGVTEYVSHKGFAVGLAKSNRIRKDSLSIQKLNENFLFAVANNEQKNYGLLMAPFGAFISFWSDDLTAISKDLFIEATAALKNPDKFRDPNDTDLTFNFFLEGHNELFNPEGPFAFLLDPSSYSQDPTAWPVTLEKAIDAFDQTCRYLDIPIHEPEDNE